MLISDAPQSGYFTIFIMTSVDDTSPINVGGLNAALDSALSYNYSLSTNIMGRVVKIARNNGSTWNCYNADWCNVLTLCNVAVYSGGLAAGKTTVYTSHNTEMQCSTS